MGWLSRNKRPSGTSMGAAVPDDAVPTDGGPAHDVVAGPEAVGQPASAPTGRYGPLVAITAFEEGAEELSWQLPVNGELYRLVPGPDRPDYSIMLLERALHFYPAAGFDLDRVPPEQRATDRKGRPMVRVHALVVCARFVGQQLHAGMQELVVNIAHVLDPSVLTDAVVDLSKLEYAAIGRMSEGHAAGDGKAAPREVDPAERAAEAAAQAPDPDGSSPAGDVDEVFRRVAQLLRQGVADQRGRPVEWLEATLTLDDQYRLAGLSGVADGEPPAPTPETFEQVNEVLAALQDHAVDPPVRRVALRASTGTVEVERLPADG